MIVGPALHSAAHFNVEGQTFAMNDILAKVLQSRQTSSSTIVHDNRNYVHTMAGLTVGLTFASALALFKVISTQRHRINRIPYLEDLLLLAAIVCYNLHDSMRMMQNMLIS